MRYLSTEEVLVTIHISERERTRKFDQLTVTPLGATAVPGLASRQTGNTHFEVTITGPYTQVTMLERDDIKLFADISDLSVGQYDLPIQWEIEGGDDLTVSVEPQTVSVTIE